ncbi:MAG: DUF2203 domain-containing protein [Deltaproteobacteria bacterium]|nr:DUF2203 domain-containing protein [Deltaproteobacteria bacterium]
MDLFVPPRLFSLREANACVPLLQDTFERTRGVRSRLDALEAELKRLGHPLEGADVRIDQGAPLKVQKLQAEAADCVAELLELLRGITELGAEVKNADGLVDFRSRFEGRVVYLCWRSGEDAITHFHELEAGFAGRAPLPENAEFAGDPLH